MKGVTVRGSIRNPKELASLVGRCNVFLYLSLPFCRQLINNKQSGDIEVAIRSIKGNVDKAKKSMKGKHKFDAADKAANKLSPRELEIYEKGMADRTDAMFDRYEASKKGPGAGKRIPKVKPKTKVTGPMRAGKMGGGKIYASMDKKYGGGIFPRKGNI